MNKTVERLANRTILVENPLKNLKNLHEMGVIRLTEKTNLCELGA